MAATAAIAVLLPAASTSAGDRSVATATELPAGCDELHDIRVNAGASTAVAQLHISLENGYFEDECLKPIRSSINSSQDIAPAIAAGQVDVGSASTGVLMSIWNAGLPITCVMATVRGGDRVAIVVAVNSGIESIEDLEGRTISVQVGSIGHQILLAALASVGLTIDDVEILNAPTADTPSLIATNQVDAVGTFEPYATAMEETGTGRVLVRGADLIGNAVNFLMFHDDFLTEQPDIAMAAMRAVYRGMQFLREEPEAAAQTLSAIYEMSPEDILTQTQYYVWNPLIDDEAAESVATDAEFLVEIGVVDAVPDFRFDETFQEAIVAEHPELIADLTD